MIPLLLFPKIFLASGALLSVAADSPTPPPLMNHTLKSEQLPAEQVVTRNCWGTPMLPNSTMGYSVIAPISQKLIAQSLWIPPVSGSRPVEAPLPTPAPAEAPVITAPIAAPVTPPAVAPTTTPAAVVPATPAAATPPTNP